MKVHFQEDIFLKDMKGELVRKTDRFGMAIDPPEYISILSNIAELIYSVPKIEGVGFLTKTNIALKILNKEPFEITNEEYSALTRWIEDTEFLSGAIKYQFLVELEKNKKDD